MLCRTKVIAAITAAALSAPPLAASSQAAAAPETRAGLLPLQVEGALPPQGDEQLGTAILMSLQTTGATVVSPAELQSALGASLATCTEPTCLRDLAAKVGVTHLLRPSVRLAESDYVLGIEVIDGSTGTLLDKTEDTCELCGLTEAVTMAGSLAASLAGALEEASATRRGGTVEITSTPSGATVLVDDAPAGVTPLSLELPAGEHRVVVRQDGYNDQEQRIVLDPGETEQVEAALDRTGPRRRPIDQGKLDQALRITAWTSLGLGVASLGSGIALIAIDETPVDYTRCSGDDVDAAGNCRFRHRTLGGGILMTVLGVVGVAAGTVLLVRDRRRSRASDRRARVLPSSRGLAVRF
ncbi:MAG: PEGA domain-containing protein [Myxococcales bacterium]|nr:PEGA domain-containing protein [Myxococcales bacterium]